MKVLLIAGEHSADIYGGHLASEIQTQCPAATIIGVGGTHIAEKSTIYLEDLTTLNAYGTWEILKNRQKFNAFTRKLQHYIKTNPIDHAVIIDLPQYNFQVAKILSNHTIPITTFITPNFWIWNDQKKIKTLGTYSENIVTIYPQEYEKYRQHYPNKTHYFGHPLLSKAVSSLAPKPNASTQSRKKIGLFPGSRPQEIHYLLPPICETAMLLKHSLDCEFTLYVPDPKLSPLITDILNQHDPENHIKTKIKSDPLDPTTTDFVICKSGTITLECLINTIPMAVLGAVSTFSYWVIKLIIRPDTKFISLPNILAGKNVVPEFHQRDINPNTIAHTVTNILKTETKQTEICTQLKAIQKTLKTPDNPFEKTAQLILKKRLPRKKPS